MGPSVNDFQMRQYIMAAYPGPKMVQKVKNMSEAQVFAMYTRIKNSKETKK